MTRGHRLLLATTVVVAIADQVTKSWARHALRGFFPHALGVVPGLLDFRYAENRGSAFGVMRGVPGLSLLVSLGVLGLLVLAWSLVGKTRLRPGRTAIEMGLICGGAIGNLLDRVFFGSVTDFVVLKYGYHEWPTFNLADLLIVVGTIRIAFRGVWEGAGGEWRPLPRWWSFRSGKAFAGWGARVAGLAIGFAGASMIVAHQGILWGFLLLGLAANVQYVGRRLQQPSAEQLRALDRRPPVLLLRAFRRDKGSILERRPRWWELFVPARGLFREKLTFEEELIRRVAHLGPPVAIGRPGETVQPSGASRMYFDDATWKKGVEKLAAEAALIVLIVDDTDGLRWELQQMPLHPGLARLLLVLPPAVLGANAERPADWYRAWESLRQSSDYLPAADDQVAAIRFSPDGRAMPILARSARAWDQLDAIESTLGSSAAG